MVLVKLKCLMFKYLFLHMIVGGVGAWDVGEDHTHVSTRGGKKVNDLLEEYKMIDISACCW